MRKAAIWAVVLVMALSGVALAKAPVASVTGTFTYFTSPGSFRTISVSAQATDPVQGTWSRTTPTGASSGPVTCLRVSGADAWLAGPTTATTEGTTPATFLWVHDGGTPGTAGDTAFGWAADPGETLADMEALCESMTTSPYGFDPFPVTSGDVIGAGATGSGGGAQVIHATAGCAVGWNDESWDADSAGGCDVQNVMTPNGGYKLILHGQIPADQMAAFAADGSPASFATTCLVNYGFLITTIPGQDWGGRMVFTDSVRHFTPDGQMTEVCERSR